VKMKDEEYNALHSCSRQELLGILADELTLPYGAELQRQPLIFEQPIPGTDTIHVLVLWERWARVPPQERGQIILEAFEQSQPALFHRITVALGLTLSEALSLGLLPYRVVPVRKSTDSVTAEQLRDALVKEGALQTPYGLMLSFPTRKLAEDAIGRLSAHIAGPYWAVQKITPASQPVS